jgi:tetratricopeptide (TPR) repeat protein
MKQGLICFERAVELDPSYAAAHSGLADSAAVLGWWGFAPPEQGLLRAKDAAQTALLLDPTFADPHAFLGFSLLHHDPNCAASEAEFQRAHELNPRYATGAQWYGILLCLTGRVDESLHELQRAIRLDPLSSVINWTFAHFLFFSRRFEETLEQGRRLLALDPDSGHSRPVLGIAWEELGKHEVALAELKRACRISGCNPNFLGCLGYAYAGAELKDRAMETISQLQELFPKPYPVAYWIAMIYAGLNQTQEACCWLETGYEERAAHMVYLKVDPRFDKLRSVPRFQSVLEGLQFPA